MHLIGFPFRYFGGVGRQRPATRRCILHAGSAKTGTSSIQSMLMKNRKRFSKHGILVPESGQRPYGAHHQLVRDLAGLAPTAADSVEQAFIREVSDSDAHTVLISSENLWPLLGVEAQAQRLLGCLRSLDFEIDVVIYIRNQPQYLNSSYVQNVKTWLRSDDFPDFARRSLAHNRKYTYSHWTAFAAAHGVKLLARPFSESMRRSGVTEDFLATIGLSSTKEFDTAIERNLSVGPFSVEVARRLMRRIGGARKLTPAQADQCRTAFRAELKRRQVEDRGYCGLTTSLAAAVEQRFAEDNASFSQSVWGKPWHEVFTSDLGQSFEPNDYAVAGIPADRRQLLGEVLHTLEARIDAIVNGSAHRESKWKRWTLSASKSRLSL